MFIYLVEYGIHYIMYHVYYETRKVKKVIIQAKTEYCLRHIRVLKEVSTDYSDIYNEFCRYEVKFILAKAIPNFN